MIRFVDLSETYWTNPIPGPEGQCCAFLDTVTDRFVGTGDGVHVFDSAEEVAELGPRFVALVPDGFWRAGG